MPRGDGTGPLGMGPITGRGAGYCAGFPTPGSMDPLRGRMGLGFGRARALLPYSPWCPRGFPQTVYPPYSPFYSQRAPYYGSFPRAW